MIEKRIFKRMKINANFLKQLLITSWFVTATTLAGLRQEAYSDNLQNSEVTNSLYVIIGVVKEEKQIVFKPIKPYEFVSGNEHKGIVKVYPPPLILYHIVIDPYYSCAIINEVATNIASSNMILFKKELILPDAIGPKDGKRQLFVAKRYFVPDGFSNSIPDSLILEMIYDESFRGKEGTREYEQALKRYGIQLPTNIPASSIATNQFQR